jgi:hypothetical protein
MVGLVLPGIDSHYANYILAPDGDPEGMHRLQPGKNRPGIQLYGSLYIQRQATQKVQPKGSERHHNAID